MFALLESIEIFFKSTRTVNDVFSAHIHFEITLRHPLALVFSSERRASHKQRSDLLGQKVVDWISWV